MSSSSRTPRDSCSRNERRIKRRTLAPLLIAETVLLVIFGSSLFTPAPALAAEPSATETARLCDNTQSGSSAIDFLTTTVSWQGICETAPTIREAALVSNDYDIALDGFGTVWFDTTPNAYKVTADSYSTSHTVDSVTLTLHDNDIYLQYFDVTVDVTITRVLQGSDIRWDVEVRDSTTQAIVDVPFVFSGTLDNENRSAWITSRANNGAWTSDGRSVKMSDPKEAILAHHVVADKFRKYAGFNSISVEVEGGTLSYFLSVLDYTGCAMGKARTAALPIAENLPATFGSQRQPLTGTPCTVTWPVPDIDPMTVGEEFDQTFVAETNVLDWSIGGGGSLIEGLPAGLEAELIDQTVTDVPPSVRIHGVPETAGPFNIKLTAMDAFFRADWIMLKGTIQDKSVPPAPGGNDDDSSSGGSNDPSLDANDDASSSVDQLAETGAPQSNGVSGIALLFLAGGATLTLARARSRLR